MPHSKPRYGLLNRFHDIIAVLKGLWFLILFDLLAVFAFIGVPQGTDTMLSIAEDLGNKAKDSLGTTIWLFVSLFFWSIASQFCARLLISLSDNSGRTLSLHRVDARKKIQKAAALVSLLLPSFILFIGFMIVWIVNHNDLINMKDGKNVTVGIMIIMALIIVMALLLLMLYYRWLHKLAKLKGLRWLVITQREKNWADKLYGIFNDVRVDIPEAFDAYKDIDLPREVILPNGMKLPRSEYFQPYKDNPIRKNKVNIWMFHIRWQFYNRLIIQLVILLAIAITIIIAFGLLLPINYYQHFGAIAMICFAFACWQLIYTGLHFSDKAQTFVPIRLLVVILFIVSSFFNNDHPVRTLAENKKDERPLLQQHFDAWFDSLQQDSIKYENYYRIHDSIPVIFIAAEGGALRTGAFTAMMLSKLADSFPSFSRYIYCYSGVSGGSAGVNLFNAEMLLPKQEMQQKNYTQISKEFFSQDFLAPVTGKMVFGEIINYFIPWHIDNLDRAIALEKSWEYGWQCATAGNKNLSASFDQTIGTGKPAVFINTTEVETGRQCMWSSVNINPLPYGKERDLYARMNPDIAYSTAVNLSSRFPLISPGGMFEEKLKTKDRDSLIRRHYIDGGYYENKGAETLFQVLQALSFKGKRIKPYIIQFNFGGEDSTLAKSVKAFNEITEIIAGIYDTRSGRGDIAQYYLRNYADSLKGEFSNIYLDLNTKQLPLNWVLSNTAISRLDTIIANAINPPGGIADKAELKKLFMYQPGTLRFASK